MTIPEMETIWNGSGVFEGIRAHKTPRRAEVLLLTAHPGALPRLVEVCDEEFGHFMESVAT